jgi:hypothetical protein
MSKNDKEVRQGAEGGKHGEWFSGDVNQELGALY